MLHWEAEILAESRSGTGPLVILVGGAPSLSSRLRLLPTAICATFSATARRTGDCAARSPVASRKQASGEVAGRCLECGRRILAAQTGCSRSAADNRKAAWM